MALEDIDGNVNKTTYTWYNAAAEKIYERVTSKKFGEGKDNTNKMIEYWNNKTYGEQNTHSTYKDIWGEIQGKVSSGWFIPSYEE